MRTGLAFLASLLTFAVLDAAWIVLVVGEIFRAQLGGIMRAEPILAAVGAFYLVYVGCLVFLAVRPALAARSLTQAAVNGAVFGLAAYATFELTNMAVIDGWAWHLVVIDVGWGVIGSAISAVAGYVAAARAGQRADGDATR